MTGTFTMPIWTCGVSAARKLLRPCWRCGSNCKVKGLIVKELVAGGSPTFGIHAEHTDRTLSPGTTVLWDFGYGDKHPDLPFLPAAVLLTRVVSKPGNDRITLDLGHKSVAPENPHPRVRFEELPEANFLMQSEEHLVIELEQRERFAIGQALHGVPRHVCPACRCTARPSSLIRARSRIAGRSRRGTGGSRFDGRRVIFGGIAEMPEMPSSSLLFGCRARTSGFAWRPFVLCRRGADGDGDHRVSAAGTGLREHDVHVDGVDRGDSVACSAGGYVGGRLSERDPSFAMLGRLLESRR